MLPRPAETLSVALLENDPRWEVLPEAGVLNLMPLGPAAGVMLQDCRRTLLQIPLMPRLPAEEELLPCPVARL